MDPRISRWAKTLVGYCLDVQPGQTVLLNAGPAAEPLLAEVYREVLCAGGTQCRKSCSRRSQQSG